MFEAERVLMTDNVIIPIYSYVSKRLVNPHLRGWQPNVLDHHPTRYMYMLRSQDASAESQAAAIDAVSQAASVEDETRPVAEDGSEPADGPKNTGAEMSQIFLGHGG